MLLDMCDHCGCNRPSAECEDCGLWLCDSHYECPECGGDLIPLTRLEDN